MATDLADHRTVRWLAAASLGALPAVVLSPSLLAQGGLAVVAVAAIVASTVGLVVASAQGLKSPTPTDELAGRLSELLLTLTAAAALASVLASTGLWGLGVVVSAWLVAAFAPSLAALGLAALLLIGSAGVALSAGLSIGEESALTLLRPWWSSWDQWLGYALIGGLLAAGAGLIDRRALSGPGWRGPAAGIGIAVLLSLGLSLVYASTYEASLSLEVAGAAPAALGTLAAAGPLLVAWRGERPRLHAGVGLIATLLLAGPGAAGLPFWWGALLPTGIAISLGLRAVSASGRRRVSLIAGALVAGGCIALTAPSLPTATAAAVLALIPVAALWVVGTPALLRRVA